MPLNVNLINFVQERTLCSKVIIFIIYKLILTPKPKKKTVWKLSLFLNALVVAGLLGNIIQENNVNHREVFLKLCAAADLKEGQRGRLNPTRKKLVFIKHHKNT